MSTKTANRLNGRAKREGLFVNISEEEKHMLSALRERSAINVSQLVRNAIRSAHQQMLQHSPLASHPQWPGHAKIGGAQ